MKLKKLNTMYAKDLSDEQWELLDKIIKKHEEKNAKQKKCIQQSAERATSKKHVRPIIRKNV